MPARKEFQVPPVGWASAHQSPYRAAVGWSPPYKNRLHPL